MAEVQKGHTYYRCHTKKCGTKTIRVEHIEETIARSFAPLQLNAEEVAYVRRWFTWKHAHQKEDSERQLEASNLQLSQIRDRMTRLTDVFLDGAIDKTMLDERRAVLLADQAGVQQRIAELKAGTDAQLVSLEKFLELIQTAPNLLKLTQPAERRTLVKRLTSNLSIGPKYAAITLDNAAQLIADRTQVPCGAPNRGVPRTWDKLLASLAKLFEETIDAET
jgi:hypothetical protein